MIERGGMGMNKRLKNLTMIALSISTILCGCTTAKDADNHVTQEQTINYTYNPVSYTHLPSPRD